VNFPFRLHLDPTSRLHTACHRVVSARKMSYVFFGQEFCAVILEVGSGREGHLRDEISSRGRPFVPQPPRVESEALHPRTQRRRLQTQQLGRSAGATDTAPRGLEGFENMAALDLIH